MSDSNETLAIFGGANNNAIVSLLDPNNEKKNWTFRNSDGRVVDPNGNLLALEGDVSSLTTSLGNLRKEVDNLENETSNLGSIYNSYNASAQENSGYSTLPGGLILQWQELKHPNYNATYNFSIPFPNKCFTIIASNIRDGGRYADVATAYALDNKTFRAYTWWGDEPRGNSTFPISILAIGN